MTIPTCSGPTTVADEAALVSAIGTLATAAGWAVTSSGTTPANSVWFKSTGEDGVHHIVGGLLPNTTTRQVSAFVAVDLDTFSIISASVGGYTNNDTAGIANRVQSQTSTSATYFPARDVGTTYRYIAAINKDAIAVLLTYTAGGALAQGVIYIGHVKPVDGSALQVQARAKISTVTAGSIAAQRTITLDRDISKALKDGSVYGSDPYTMRLQFHCVATSSADSPDFAMVERIPIVAGTLSAPGSNTSFEINATTGVKLAASGRRYASNRGAGDIVSLMSEPTMVMCAASATYSIVFNTTTNTFLSAWDSYCGQAALLDCIGDNEQSSDAQYSSPVEMSGRYAYYPLYAITYDKNTGLVTQSDNQGIKNVGALKNIMIFPSIIAPDLSIFKINGDASRRYRTQQRTGTTGIRAPNHFDTNTMWGIGPGW